MSQINMTLGGKPKVAVVTVKDTNGNVVPPSQVNLSFALGTPNVVNPSSTTEGNESFIPANAGSTTVVWTAQQTNGGQPVGSPVSAPSDTLVVAQAPIAEVDVQWNDLT